MNPMKPPFITGLYLGAGRSSRMGMPKLSIRMDTGSKLGELALAEALRSHLDHIVIVTSKSSLPDWLPVEEPFESSKRWSVIECEQSHLGLSYSIRAGLKAAMIDNPDAIVILLADQPLIHAEMINRLIAAITEDRELDYAASLDCDKAKPPILLSRSMFHRLEAMEGDQGARELLVLPELRGKLIAESNRQRFLDADTEEDLTHIVNEIRSHLHA